MLKRNCDALLFINVEIRNAKQGDKEIKRAVSTNEKYFFTDHHYAYDAKNLFGLPAKIKFMQEGGWAYIQSLKGDPNDPKVKQQRIEAYYPQMEEKEIEWAKKKMAEGELDKVLNNLREAYGE